MSTLVILQCTNKKLANGQPMLVNDPFAAVLGPARNQLIAQHNQLLNYQQLKPAYERYGAYQAGRNGGRLYMHIDWPTALAKIQLGKLQIIIASALFGVIEYDTPIPEYNLTMNIAQQTWLAGNLLGNAVQNYIRANPAIVKVKSFVSGAYLGALGTFVPPGVTNLGNDWVYYDRGSQTAEQYVNPFIQAL